MTLRAIRDEKLGSMDGEVGTLGLGVLMHPFMGASCGLSRPSDRLFLPLPDPNIEDFL